MDFAAQDAASCASKFEMKLTPAKEHHYDTMLSLQGELALVGLRTGFANTAESHVMKCDKSNGWA